MNKIIGKLFLSNNVSLKNRKSNKTFNILNALIILKRLISTLEINNYNALIVGTEII
jgi:hypothetical protein